MILVLILAEDGYYSYLFSSNSPLKASFEEALLLASLDGAVNPSVIGVVKV